MSMIKDFVEQIGRSEEVVFYSLEDNKEYYFEPTEVVYSKEENFVALDGKEISVDVSAEDFLSQDGNIYFTAQGNFTLKSCIK